MRDTVARIGHISVDVEMARLQQDLDVLQGTMIRLHRLLETAQSQGEVVETVLWISEKIMLAELDFARIYTRLKAKSTR